MAPNDSAVRSYDNEAPAEPAVSENFVDYYNTAPQWSWNSSGDGDNVFRYRLNGGEWTVLDGNIESTTYAPPALVPGRYVLEVQERDSAGNWSDAGRFETLIKVREPEIRSYLNPGGAQLPTVATPDIITGPPSPPQVFNSQDGTPHFEWDIPAGRVQYGVNDEGRTVEYGIVLERRNGDTFDTVEAVERTASTGYSVASQLSDGEYRFGVSTWSTGGAISDPTQVTFIVDTTAPGAPTVDGPSVVSNAAAATSFTITPNSGDTVQGYDWRVLTAGGEVATAIGGTPLSGTNQPSPINITLSAASSGPGKGSYTLEVRQRDSAGNVGAAATFAVTVETIPTIVLVGANPTNSVTPQFQITGNDDGNLLNNFRWVIDGVPTGATFSSPGSMTDTFVENIPSQPDSGTYTISVAVQQQRSGGGFSDSSAAVAVTIDRDPPIAPSISSQPASPSDGQDLTIQMATGETAGQLSYSFTLGSASLSGVTTSGSLTITGSTTTLGPFTIDGAASPFSTISVDFSTTDSVGNVGANTAVSFNVDTTPPAVPTGLDSADLIGSVPNQETQDTTPTFTWNAVSEPNVTYEYSLDEGVTAYESTGASTSVTVPALAFGRYDFVVRAVDEVGNASPPTPPVTFYVVEPATGVISVTNPTTPTFNISGGGATLSRAASESWTLSVNPGAGVTISSYEWRINGDMVGSGSTQGVAANDAATQLGENTLTLIVWIGGVPYSDSFFFTVVN